MARDDGEGLRRVSATAADATPPYTNVRDEWPSWSSDGRRILFLRGIGSESELRVLSLADGSTARFGRSTSEIGLPRIDTPAWSPDGRSVVFASVCASCQAFTNLYVMNEDGGVREITRGPPYFFAPTFTRDGRRILAVRYTPGQGQPVELWSLALDGSDRQRVFVSADEVIRSGPFTLSNLQYALSPDGRRLALNANGKLFSTQLANTTILQRHAQIEPVIQGGTAFADEPTPRLLLAGGPQFSQLPLSSVELNDSGQRRTILERASPQEVDQHPAWLPDTPPPVADLTPPALELAGGTAAVRLAKRKRPRYPRMAARSIRLQAFDSSGVRSVESSVSRLVHTRRGTRCRFLDRRGFGRPRRCGRPRFSAATSAPGLRARLARLRAGRYRLDVRANDVHARRSRPKLLRFSVAPRKTTAKRR